MLYLILFAIKEKSSAMAMQLFEINRSVKSAWKTTGKQPRLIKIRRAEQIFLLYMSEDKGAVAKKGIKAPVSRLSGNPGSSCKHLRCSLYRCTFSRNGGDAPLKLFKWRVSVCRGIKGLFAVRLNLHLNSNSGSTRFKWS